MSHGMSNTKVYFTWHNMRNRCDRSTTKSYSSHGGRGISYDPAWNTFENFYADVGDPPHENSTLDRIDNNGNYTKDNVRWTSYQIQAFNRGVHADKIVKYKGVSFEKSKNLYRARITLNGKTKSLGRKKTAIECAKLYDAAVEKYHGPDGVTNKDLGLL